MIVILGLEAGELFNFRTNQQGTDEEVVPGELVDDANADAMLRLRAAEEIRDEQLVLAAKRFHEVLIEAIERLRIHRPVGLAPPNRALARRIADDEAVLGAPAGVLAGANDQRSVLRQQALVALHGILHEGCRRQVPMELCARLDALIVQAEVRNPVGQRKIPFVQ